jgi:hypothetical protein
MRSPVASNCSLVLTTKMTVLLAWLALVLAFPCSTAHGQPTERRTAADAEKAAAEGAMLLLQGTSAAALQAIAKFEEARRIYQQEKEPALEAAMLIAVSKVYIKTLSDNAKARMMLAVKLDWVRR